MYSFSKARQIWIFFRERETWGPRNLFSLREGTPSAPLLLSPEQISKWVNNIWGGEWSGRAEFLQPMRSENPDREIATYSWAAPKITLDIETEIPLKARGEFKNKFNKFIEYHRVFVDFPAFLSMNGTNLCPPPPFPAAPSSLLFQFLLPCTSPFT